MEYNSEQQTIINCDAPNILVNACFGSGKALDNTTGVLTPQGYKPIGQIKIGDIVFDGNGKQTIVTAVYPQGKKQVYEVEDSYGNVIRCCGEHLWQFQTRHQRNHKNTWNIKTTKEILDNFPLFVKGNSNHKNIYLPQYNYIDFNEQLLPLHPYLLGALISNNSLHSIIEGNSYKNIIQELGLDNVNSKTIFIPDIYKYNSVYNRLELLKGLMDSNGTHKGSTYEYTTASKQLADDIEFLCYSLGYIVKQSIVEDGTMAICNNNNYHLYIKANKYKRGQAVARNCIVRITPLKEQVEMTCITVQSEAHTYIIEHGIVTHNTTTLVGSIQRYKQLHPNDHITAITFTKKAAESLAERVNDRKVEISTIHSWAYRRLQEIGNKYGFRISLLEENVIKDILKQLCLKRRQFYINQFQLYSFVMGNYNIDVDEKIKHTLNLLRKDYINYKQQNKLYDFTDLPKYLYDMCIEYQYIITDTDALFVDEFQDIDPVQLDVFDIVAARKRMYIGDYKQAIYGFRGACVGIFDKLIAKGGWTVFDLKINYRSKQEIADYATSLYKETVDYAKRGSVFNADIEDIIYKHEIDCERKFGGTVVRIGETEDDCYIFDTSEYYWEKGDALHTVKTFLESNVQILCRSNKQVKKIQSMGWQNVSTVHQAKGLEYDSVILVNNYGDNIEELNILYVGITRAKNMLCIIDYDMLLYCLANCQNLKKSNVLF